MPVIEKAKAAIDKDFPINKQRARNKPEQPAATFDEFNEFDEFEWEIKYKDRARENRLDAIREKYGLAKNSF